MTTNFCGAALAFFAFAVSLIIGLYVGNSFVTVVLRSLVVLILSYILGVILTSLGQRAVVENLEREITKFHSDAEQDSQISRAASETPDDAFASQINAEQTAAQPPPEPVVSAAAAT